MPDTTQLASTVADRLIEAFSVYSTPAWEMSLAATQADATLTIYAGVACFISASLMGCLMTIFIVLSFKSYKYYLETSGAKDFSGFFIFAAVVCGFVGLCLLISALVNLLSLWSWYGMYHPDVYLAHKILNGITN